LHNNNSIKRLARHDCEKSEPYIKEWETCFDNTLKELWCEWGGLTTISKKDFLFHENHTGEKPGSYHNGDSWFWINNLAGIVLTDLNKEKYHSYIKKILEASTKEILFSGAAGYHAELSSASSLKSQGAICQSFSAGMYIEFIEKIRENKLSFPDL
jgi:glycogen debranching enzyme